MRSAMPLSVTTGRRFVTFCRQSIIRPQPRGDLSLIFAWDRLEPMLRIDWSIQTEEPNDPDNPLAPPIRYRHYPVSQVVAARCELFDDERRPRRSHIDRELIRQKAF